MLRGTSVIIVIVAIISTSVHSSRTYKLSVTTLLLCIGFDFGSIDFDELSLFEYCIWSVAFVAVLWRDDVKECLLPSFLFLLFFCRSLMFNV